ncbi:MAG: two-component system response regulator [Candidatus Cloacimonetes bacterium HGW-Cloacimonetes-1]|jgi:CheY-like chemotaxis protein|nr:MAG: two-component system response regulator [Candidatus Cloacimonetes bacterium HGW-Cloacimonetes-1]
MNNKTILLIEDNPSDIELTRRALSKSRICNDLAVVEDGVDALDYLFCTGNYANRNCEEMPTLILLDLHLPRIDGLEVLKKIRSNSKTSRIPVVVLTSSREDIDVAACYDNGANSYIRKPVDFSQFTEAVNQLGLYWLVINEAPPIA